MVGFLNDSATVTRALEQLENGTPAQKISAIEALGRSRDRRVPPALTRALADPAVWNRTPGAGNHPDYVFVARSASKSLVRIGAAAVPALIGALARDECVDLPAPCVEVSFGGCFYIGDYSFDRVYVAQLAAQALARIGRPAKPALYHVLALIADARPAVREAARSAALVLAPGELDPGPVDLETLLAASVDRGDEGERTKWTRSLHVFGEHAVPALTRALSDPEAPVREAAAHQLGRIGRPASAAAAPLAELLTEGHEVGFVAAWALGRVGPAALAFADQLANATEQPGSERIAAAETLAKLGVHLDLVKRVVAEEARSQWPWARQRARRLWIRWLWAVLWKWLAKRP